MTHWRIGELAAATGLTVRTLHHYEQVGLLQAAGRTEGNHRVYDEEDLARLYRICALRALGLSLAEIGPLLDGAGGRLGPVLQRHLARAEDELARLTQQRDRLRRLCAQAEARVAPADLLALLGAMAHLERHAARDARRRPRNGEARWRDLGAELRAHLEADDPPTAPAVQAVALRVQAEIEAYTRGDPAAQDALALVRRLDPPEDLAGWDPALFRYLEDALTWVTPRTL